MSHRAIFSSLIQRTGAFARIGLLLFVVCSGAVGCVDCEKRFCRGVRVSTVQLMSVADRCCMQPDLPGCEDPEGFFQMVVDKLMAAYDACHENNYDRMSDLLEELLELLPFFSLKTLCDDHLALDDSLRDWLDGRCDFIRNQGTLFGPEDTIALTVLVPFDRMCAMHAGHRTIHSIGAGSDLTFDAWFASGRSAVGGRLVLGSERPLPGGGRIIPVEECLFEIDSFPGRGPHHVRSVSSFPFAKRSTGWIVLDEFDVGRIGIALCFEGEDYLIHGPLWFECPVSLSRGTLRMESTPGAGALELFPVVDSIHELFGIVNEGTDAISTEGLPDFDPCERVGGSTRRALAWLQRLRTVFPECFPEGSAGE